jgi:hypothetical protein
MSLNSNQKLRDKILGISKDARYAGGVEHFKGLTIEKLEELVKHNFISFDEQQNDAPMVEEFYLFLKDHPNFTLHGYAVHDERSDYRVSIEGMELNGKSSMSDMLDFVRLCRYADEFVCEQDKLYSWWT